MPVGLSSAQAGEALRQHGYNEIVERQAPAWQRLLKWFVHPASLMMELALAISWVAGKSLDAVVILFMLLFNVGMSFYHQYSAENAVALLRQKLTITSRVYRDGQLARIEARLLVPGDVLVLERGDVVPADAALLEAADVSVDESMLSGESLPKQKKTGDMLYSTSIVRSGRSLASVHATGTRTFFGKTLRLIETAEKRGVIEHDVVNITKFLIVVGMVSLAILAAYFLWHGKSWLDIAELAVAIAISSFPVALPAVITLVTSLGVLQLSQKQVVVRRLAALDDLADVDLLLTDKTGTLTQNRITVAQLVPYVDGDENLLRKALSACNGLDDVIDGAVLAEGRVRGLDGFKTELVVPASSESKLARAEATVSGRNLIIVKGAEAQVAALCKMPADVRTRFEADVARFSAQGFKVLAVASGSKMPLTLDGLVLLRDPPRDDASEAIAFLKKNGVHVKMVTGDNRYVAAHVSDELGLGRRVLAKEDIHSFSDAAVGLYDAFAELYPKDKFDLVKASREHHVVAVTGDGVNDIPAIREADVGIAVSNATDAAKASADVVLLSPGISVVKDALLEGRTIMEKLQYYSIYRISESLRVILTILVLGLWLGNYPLSPLQLILLSLLNDLPIIAIAFDHVKVAPRPQTVHFTRRTALSAILGLVGVLNSVLLVVLALDVLHLPVALIQSMFFLKLALGGHLLLLVVRTTARWYDDLPSAKLAAAIVGTQLVAVGLVFFGIFMPALPLPLILLTAAWTFFWMQVSEVSKSWAWQWLHPQE